MAATPPLPPDDDSQSEGPTIPSVAPGVPTPTPTAPADQDSTLGTRDPQSTLISLMNQRSGRPMDLGLRDQEHAAFSRYVLDRLGPLLGPAVVATSVPAYSAVKGGAQAMGMMKDATPASVGEVKAGLAPLAQLQNYPQLYTLMRLLGVIR
jgi:hypothetical protein